jgi:hypothetical protein
VWCPLPIELGKNDGLAFESKLREQGFRVTWFEDCDDEGPTNFFSCMLSNYKKMATGGAFTVISHGNPGEHLIVYAPWTPTGRDACELWRTGDTNLIVREYPNWCYAVAANSNWLTSNFKGSADKGNALTVLSICYSAATVDPYGNSAVAVKEAAGGRWRVGYALSVCMSEAADVNNELLGRMNGTIANGGLRTAGDAHTDPGVDYQRIGIYGYDDNDDGAVDRQTGSVRMNGDAWTTLCPAPLKQTPFYPAASVAKQSKGWGCFLLDTYLNIAVPAGEAALEPWTDACSGFRWLAAPEGGGCGLGFYFENPRGEGSLLLIDAGKVRNAGTEGRKMDGDRVAPNGDSIMQQF